MLAIKGNAGFEGVSFLLYGNFGDTIEQRISEVLKNIPYNVTLWFKDDLFSNKVSPLLYDQLNKETNELVKHNIALLITLERPKNWKNQILNYISDIPKNSFFLYDIFKVLRIQYQYSFASNEDLKSMAFLIKAGIAKHKLGTKAPGINTINKVSDKVLPPRNLTIENDEVIS